MQIKRTDSAGGCARVLYHFVPVAYTVYATGMLYRWPTGLYASGVSIAVAYTLYATGSSVSVASY
jgi:predicted membrane chloride channel (bestrophin family)